MSIRLRRIDFEVYEEEHDIIEELIKTIWTNPNSYTNAIESIKRWYEDEESGKYFYILKDKEIIGITGYWPISEEEDACGLRHHGVLLKGYGKKALDKLIEYLNIRFQKRSYLVELLPEHRKDLIEIFTKWGFVIDPKGIPDWEPKKEYYTYCMRKYTR